MSAARLIARGIGFAPGSTKYIITAGLLAGAEVPVVVAQIQNTGGWESYLAHRKRQEQRAYEEEKLQEQIEAQRLAVEDAQLRLELDQERKAEEERRDGRRNRVIAQIARGIKAQQSEIEQMMAHLEDLMVLDALERDQELQALIQKRRNAAIVLLLYAA